MRASRRFPIGRRCGRHHLRAARKAALLAVDLGEVGDDSVNGLRTQTSRPSSLRNSIGIGEVSQQTSGQTVATL
jgi:hypothetical protein